MKLKNVHIIQPNWIISILTAVGFLCVGAYFAFISTSDDSGIVQTIVKLVPCVMLSIWVFYKRFPHILSWIVGVALLFTAVGDFFMEGASELSLLLGIGANLIAHIFYIIGFTIKFKGLKPLRAIAPLIYFGGLLYILIPNLEGFMTIAVIMYCIIIGLMAWRAAAVLGQTGKIGYEEIMGFAGACLFIACDTLIALDKFVNPILNVQYWIMGCYWIGQWAIAFSFIQSKDAATPSAVPS